MLYQKFTAKPHFSKVGAFQLYQILSAGLLLADQSRNYLFNICLMKNFLNIVFLYILTLGGSQAQLDLKIIGNADVPGIDLHFKFRNYQLSRIVARQSFLKQLQNGNCRLELTLPDNERQVFVLSEAALLADDYVETVAGINRVSKTAKASVKTFIGHQENGMLTVTATIDDDFFTASVHGGGQSWHIEQVSSFKQCAPDLLVTYSEADVLQNDSFKCGIEEVQQRAAQVSTTSEQARESSGNCYQVKLAIATDASMYDRYGSERAVRNRVLSTMNNVAQIFRQQFVNNIEFKIVAIYISKIDHQDPFFPNTTSVNSSELLTAFRGWAYTNNEFNMQHNMGQLWTTRIMPGATAVGNVSTVKSGICNRNTYHVLTDAAGQDVKKRVSHEMGHNFSAGHDAERNYSGYIMTPGYSPGLEWSDASRAAINNYLGSSTATECLSSCTEAVKSSFEMTSAGACTGNSVQFKDRSVNGTSDRLWELEGGTPSQAIEVNPLVSYSTAGLYDVKLTSSGNSLLQRDYVFVSSPPKLRQTNCRLPTGDSGGGGIRMIGLNGTYIFPTKQDSIPKYIDQSCRYIIALQEATNYDFLAKIGSVTTETTSQIREHLKIYIDYNNDGLFNETNELVVKSSAAQGPGLLINEDSSKPWLNFTTPASVVENTFLRMRVISDNVVPANSCHSPQTGQMKDFAVVFRKQQALPVKLTHFKVFCQENVARLDWGTVSELNSDRFEVECSGDLISWITVGSIPSEGTTDKTVRYQFADTTVHTGLIYYRLRMIDQDGSFTYSNVRSVTFHRKGSILHPNPASDRIWLNKSDGTELSPSQIEEISITSPTGIVVYKQKFPISYNGMPIRNLKNGTYFVKVTLTDGAQSSHKLIIFR